MSFPLLLDPVKRGEALANFEKGIIQFQSVLKAAALCIRALIGGIHRTLAIYRRGDHTTTRYDWRCLQVHAVTDVKPTEVPAIEITSPF